MKENGLKTVVLVLMLLGIVVIITLLTTASTKEKSVPIESTQIRYEFQVDKNAVARLDRETGEIIAFNQGKVFKIDNEYIAKETEKDENLSKLVIRPPRRFPDTDSRLLLATARKWQQGNLCYKLVLKPFRQELSPHFTQSNAVTFRFCDSDDFVVVSDKMSLNAMNRTVEGGESKSWTYQASILCSKEDYLRIAYITYTWTFSDTLKATLKTLPNIIDEYFFIPDDLVESIDWGMLCKEFRLSCNADSPLSDKLREFRSKIPCFGLADREVIELIVKLTKRMSDSKPDLSKSDDKSKVP